MPELSEEVRDAIREYVKAREATYEHSQELLPKFWWTESQEPPPSMPALTQERWQQFEDKHEELSSKEKAALANVNRLVRRHED